MLMVWLGMTMNKKSSYGITPMMMVRQLVCINITIIGLQLETLW
jgi:hypothetical protein